MLARLCLISLFILAACGGGSGGTAALPQRGGPLQGAAQMVHITLTVPPTTQSGARSVQTVSPSTQSVGFVVNGAAAQTFNATPTSGGCSTGAGGTTCTFSVSAPAGSDTFVITTYSGLLGAGYPLDQTTAILVIAANGNNGPSVVLGPVISNTNDSGPGSLRQAIADANAGDTLTYIGAKPGVITLTTTDIALTKNVTISGPGASNLTISGGGTLEILKISSGVTATINGVTIANGASNAGVAGIDDFGALTLDSDVFSNNRNTSGYPGTSNGYGGAISEENAAGLTVTNTTFTNNYAIYYGGAIFTAASAGSPTISGCTFSSNVAAQEGGAIYFTGTAAISNDTFGANTAGDANNTGYGGAVAANSGITINGGSFTNNISGLKFGSYGGAVYSSGSVNVSNVTFTGNVAGSTTDNTIYGYGGAIYQANTGTVTISGSTFTSNAAGASFGYGGALYAYGPLTSTNDTFSGNLAYGGGTNGYAYGGAVESVTSANLTADTFTSNQANGPTGCAACSGYAYGGALDEQAGTTTLSGVTFTSNSISTGGTGSYGYGGAMNATGPTNTLTNVAFSGNFIHVGVTGSGNAAYGGGAYISGTNSLTNTSFSNNSLTAGGSGAVSAYAYGGGAQIGGTTTINGGSYLNNSAAALGPSQHGQGGGLLSSNAITINGSTFSSNSASTRGGGVETDSTATITNSTISGNTVSGTYQAYDGGGGIYAANNLTLTGSTVSGNTAYLGFNGSSTGGGGIFGGGTATWTNDTISGNSAASTIVGVTTIDGGGLYELNTTGPTLINVTVFKNTATGNGGNIFLATSAPLSLENSIVAGGMAGATPTANDIFTNGVLTSLGYNIIQTAVTGSGGFNPQGSDQFKDPLLLALANNGGTTLTNADQSGSPGTDHIPWLSGSCNKTGVTADQRGNPRNDGATGFCDVGAYEYP